MERQKTIGIIIYRYEGKSIRYLLLHHGGEYWNFPKGRPEAGETDMETALRELREETAITNVTIVDGFSYHYDYDFDSHVTGGVRQRAHKTAIFFLGQVANETVTISNEHIDYGWFDFDTALKRLFFQNGQDLLKRAHQFLLGQQDFVL